MAQATTPGNVDTSVAGKDLTVTWTGPIENGNGFFSIQFVDRNDDTATVPAPGIPPGGVKVTAVGINYSTVLTYPTDTAAQNVFANYQAQVQAMAVLPEDDSDWGKQLWWDIGFSVTVLIGSTPITLTQLSGGRYALPVSKDHPLEVTYDDLTAFVESLPGALTLPGQWPNGDKIQGSLLVTTFVIDVPNKTFEFDFSVALAWTIFDGLTVQTIGLDIRRTNGSSLMTA